MTEVNETNEIEEQIYRIPSWNMKELTKRLAKLNKKAMDLDCPVLELTEHGTDQDVHPRFVEAVSRGILNKKDVPHYTVHLITLSGGGPKLAGWKFVGTLDHNTLPGSVVVKTVPGEKVPEEFFHNDAVCDHCDKIRRRIETFVVEHEEGEFKQVGRQCIRDFLGHDPKRLLALLSSIRKLVDSLKDPGSDFYGGGSGWVDWTFDHQTVLEVTSAIIRTHGWVSRALAKDDWQKIATSSDVDKFFFPPSITDHVAYREWRAWKDSILWRPEEDKTDAEAAIAWLADQEPRNEYMHNLQAIAAAEAVPSKMFGFWCSLMSSYQRAMDRLREQERTQKLNEWYGEVKDKVELTIEVVSINHFNGAYGVVSIHRMLDTEGRTFIWFANCESGMTVGHKYVIKGTVKKHNEFKSWKQTVLTRVKKIEELE